MIWFRPIFRQFVNLIKHNTMQHYSRWNTSNHMLSEKKKKQNKKLTNTNATTKHYTFATSLDQQSWRYSLSLISQCLQFFNKKLWRSNLKSKKKDPKIKLLKREVNLNYTKSNSYNGADLMFLFKEGLSLIIRRLSFSSNIYLLFSLVRTLKHLNDGEWLQSNKWSLVNGEILICSLILTLRCLHIHNNKIHYGECVRQLNITMGEHTGISPLTKKKFKPNGSAVSDHLLLCNHSLFFKCFSVLTKENRKFILELKESLLIMK